MNIIFNTFCIMKNKLLLFLLSFVFAIFNVSAQSIDDFCMPSLRSAEDAVKYIGKQVIVYQRNTKDPKYRDTSKFDNYFYGTTDKLMTIKKIKFGSQIVFHLVTETGYKLKVPVNLNGAVNYDGLSSCNISYKLVFVPEYILNTSSTS